MTDDEIRKLTFGRFAALRKRHAERERAEEERLAMMLATIGHFMGVKRKDGASLQPADFMRARPKTEDEQVAERKAKAETVKAVLLSRFGGKILKPETK